MLTELELHCEEFTDADLAYLGDRIEFLDLRGTQVSGAGLAAVRAAYPGCELVADSGHPFAVYR